MSIQIHVDNHELQQSFSSVQTPVQLYVSPTCVVCLCKCGVSHLCSTAVLLVPSEALLYLWLALLRSELALLSLLTMQLSMDRVTKSIPALLESLVMQSGLVRVSSLHATFR